MISSGFIKRGLASTAIAALAVAGVPALAGTAHAAPGTVTVAALTAYDLDEFTTGGPDLVVSVKETNGTSPTVGQDVEFSYVFTPEGGQPQPATTFALGGTTGGDGTVDLNWNPAAAGTYTVTVRTVGSHVTAPAFTFVAGQAEIVWADGASARSPRNSTDTYEGTLALDNAAATPLAGRIIPVHMTSGGDVIMATPQPAGTARVDDDDANATTGANGKFSVGLTDPAANPAADDDATLTAGTGTPFEPAATLNVAFEPTPVVTKITVTNGNVTGGPLNGGRGPGKPVELNVVVQGQAVADNNPDDDPVLKDIPVTFSVDKGFLTPDTKGAGLNVAATDLKLTADQDDEGDLFGFYENLGATTTVDTSDNAATDAAGVVATIEKDADFADDGLATQTVTVTAGGKSAQVTIDYDSANYLNLPAAAFVKDSGVSKVGNKVELKLFAADQYGNLVGGEQANVTDNTPVARVDAENGGVRTDFVNDNPSVTATSTGAVEQVITANIPAHKTLVDASGNPLNSVASTTTAKYTVKWTKGKTGITATLTGNGGAKDKLKVTTTPAAKGATVTLYKIVKGKKKQIGQKSLNNKGKANFTKKDLNGKKVTKYFVKVAATSTTKGKRSATVKVK